MAEGKLERDGVCRRRGRPLVTSVLKEMGLKKASTRHAGVEGDRVHVVEGSHRRGRWSVKEIGAWAFFFFF